MPRKLKTYTTSAGFFDLAIAAPSMKAALEAWGSASNLFQQGFARQTDDPEIVAATMAKPGIVLRRAVGTNESYSENAKLPTSLPAGRIERGPVKSQGRRGKTLSAPTPAKPLDAKVAAEAARAYEREQERRQRAARREEAERKKEDERRERAVAKAEAALDDAKRRHEKRLAELEKARAEIERKAEAEQGSWEKEKSDLEKALRQARAPRHLRLV